MSESESLFKKLTDLFRSGPRIRRKVKPLLIIFCILNENILFNLYNYHTNIEYFFFIKSSSAPPERLTRYRL